MGILDKLFGKKKNNVPEKEIVFEKRAVISKDAEPTSNKLVVDIHEPTDEYGRTRLQQAALAGEDGTVSMQLSLGAHVDHRDNENKTALHFAAMKGHVGIAKQLLDAGADINAICVGHMTPLIWAAQENHPEVVQLLVDRGANLDIQRDGGMTALMHVWMPGHEKVAAILLKAGASTTKKNDQGQTALDCVRAFGASWYVPILEKMFAGDFDAADDDEDDDDDECEEKDEDEVAEEEELGGKENEQKTEAATPESKAGMPQADASDYRPLSPATKDGISLLKQCEKDGRDEAVDLLNEVVDMVGNHIHPDTAAALIRTAHEDVLEDVRAHAVETLYNKFALTEKGASLVNSAVFNSFLTDKSKYVLREAMAAVEHYMDPASIEPLLDIVRSYRDGQDFTSAQYAITTLGKFGDEAVPILIKEVKNGPAERGLAYRALAATASEKAFDVLAEGMSDTGIHSYDQEDIAEGLAKIGTSQAIEVLKKSLDSAEDLRLLKTIEKCLKNLNVETGDLEDKKKEAEIRSVRKLLDGLKALHAGMTEDEADKLVGAGNFQMGANVVHNTRFGNFQLIVIDGKVQGVQRIDKVIENAEKWLKEQA